MRSPSTWLIIQWGFILSRKPANEGFSERLELLLKTLHRSHLIPPNYTAQSTQELITRKPLVPQCITDPPRICNRTSTSDQVTHRTSESLDTDLTHSVQVFSCDKKCQHCSDSGTHMFSRTPYRGLSGDDILTDWQDTGFLSSQYF